MHGGQSAQQSFDDLYAIPESDPAFEDRSGSPRRLRCPIRASSSATPVYDRGAMTLQALRAKVGDPTFFDIVRSWYLDNKYGNVNTADFIAHAEQVSGQQLDNFFRVWLYEEGRPESW